MSLKIFENVSIYTGIPREKDFLYKPFVKLQIKVSWKNANLLTIYGINDKEWIKGSLFSFCKNFLGFDNIQLGIRFCPFRETESIASFFFGVAKIPGQYFRNRFSFIRGGWIFSPGRKCFSLFQKFFLNKTSKKGFC